MSHYQDVLKEEVKKWCKPDQSVEEFVNIWVKKHSISALVDRLLAYGVNTNYNSVWKTFRPMIKDESGCYKSLSPHPHPGPGYCDRDGFVKKNVIEVWDKKLKEKGFRNLRDAIQTLKKRGLNYTEMARIFGICPRAFRWRRKRINDYQKRQ